MNLYQVTNLSSLPRTNFTALSIPMLRFGNTRGEIIPINWATWNTYLYEINDYNGGAVTRITSPDFGASSGIDGGKLKYHSQIWAGRNIVNILGQSVDRFGFPWGRVQTIPTEHVPSYDKYNKYTTPHLVHEVYGYSYPAGYKNLSTTTICPVLGDGDWYVRMSNLVSVDSQLPKIVTIISSVRCREFPDVDSGVIQGFIQGSRLIVTKVVVSGGGIWGQIAYGWIPLRFNNINFTDWSI